MSSKIKNSHCFFEKVYANLFSKLPPMVTGGLTILPLSIKPPLAIITPSFGIPRFFPDTVFLSERHPWVVLPRYLFKQVAVAVPRSLLRVPSVRQPAVPTVRLDLPGRAVGELFAPFVALRDSIFPAHFFGKCGTAPWPLTGPSSVSENRVRHHAS